MDAGLSAQYAVIAMAVVFSAIYVVRRQFPHATRRLRIALALALLHDARPRWMRAIGRRVAPATVVDDAACGRCNGGCAPAGRAR